MTYRRALPAGEEVTPGPRAEVDLPSKEQVWRALAGGSDYEAAGRELRIPPGQAYMIATGVPADGSDTITEEEARRPGFLPSSQRLANPPHDNPTARESVSAWMKARVAADDQMRSAMRQRTADKKSGNSAEGGAS